MDQSEASIERLHGAAGPRASSSSSTTSGRATRRCRYLRRLPLDTIKVDRSFVSGPGHGRRPTPPIVQAVISLAHGLGIEVVAEGIETAAQRRLLRALGCDRGQGYLFARPLPEAAVEALLAAADGRVSSAGPEPGSRNGGRSRDPVGLARRCGSLSAGCRRRGGA